MARRWWLSSTARAFDEGKRAGTWFGPNPPGADHEPLTEKDVLGPSEAMRHSMEYYADTRSAAGMLERLAALEPTTLTCMHGAAYRGDGARLLRALAGALQNP